MIRARTFIVICALALPIALVAAGCDSGPSDRDPMEVLKSTFDNDSEVTSGVIDIALSGTATGQESGSFSASLGGAFQMDSADEREVPQVDLSGTITGEGQGESVDESARLVITDANAFLEYGGETYEAGEESFASLRDEVKTQVDEAGLDDERPLRQACEEAVRQSGGDPAACDIDVAEDWLTNLENEGTEEIEGVETIHVSGDLDVEQVLTDLTEFGPSSVGGFNTDGFNPSQLAPAIPEASFDLYSGAEDEELRRLEVRLVIDPSAVTGGFAVLPIERVELDFSINASELNEPQTIEAPTGPTTPLEQLLGAFGPDALEGFGGLPDLGGGSAPDDSEPAPSPPGDDPGAGAQGLPEGMDPEQAQEYLECIQEAAQSGNQEAFDACAEQL